MAMRHFLKIFYIFKKRSCSNEKKYQFNPGNAPLNRRVENTTHELGLSYRFGGAMGLL